MLTGLAFGGQNALRLAGNLILTRLLFPEAFGIMALIHVVVTGLNMFSDIGIKSSIVQDARGEDPVFLDTAWTAQIGRGVLLWAVTWVIAGPVAAFYGEPVLAALLPVAGLTALFQGFNSTKLATANRALTLGRVTSLMLGAQSVGLAVMIGLAVWLESVWALAIGGLFPPFLVAVLSHVVLPGHRNRLAFEADAAKRLLHFGKYIFIATLAGFVINHADRAVLGKIVTLSDLALYNIAFFFASVPLLLMHRLSQNVLFPYYRAKLPLDTAADRAQVARTRFVIISGLMTGLLGLALVGNFLVVALYDARYEAAGLLLPLIALAQLPVLVGAGYDAMPLARGQSGRFAAIVILNALLQTTSLLIGANAFGLLGVILAPAITGVLSYPLIVLLIRRYGGWQPLVDLALAGIGLTGAAVVLWINADTVAAALRTFPP